MAIESSNKSPSPMSSRQSANPNFSNSKNHSGVRRSANGNPFPKPSVVAHPSAWCSTPKMTTAANSPAEIGRRNSFSNMNEHKENKKPDPNLKPIKGAKNFMSPTISAVSKVNPSPRKKALAERNDSVRTSASLSDGKFLFFAGAGDDDLKSETENCDFQEEIHVPTRGAKKRVTFDDDVVVLSPEVFSGYAVDEPSESLFGSQMVEPIDFALDEIKEPSLDISETASFVSLASPIAPLDADPLVQPYDPKTNFLSPRPQFLRYKPPEDLSLDLNSHLLKSFEDTLSSETCSDSDVESNVEEVKSEEAPAQEEEFLGSSNKSPSAKLECTDECVLKPDEDEEEVCAESEEETSYESEIASEPRVFSRWRIIGWLLIVGSLLSSMMVSYAPHEGADFSGSLHRVKECSSTPSEFLNFSASICDAKDHFSERKASGVPSEEVTFLTEIGIGVHEEMMDSSAEEMALLQTEQDINIEEYEQVEVNYSHEDQLVEESGQVAVDSTKEEELIEESEFTSHPEIELHPNLESTHEEIEEAHSNTELPKLDDPELEMEVASEQAQITEQTEKEDEVNTVVEARKDSELPKLDDRELEMEVASEQAHFTEQAEKEDEVNTVVEAHKGSELPKLDDPELEMEVASQVELEMEVASEQAHFTEQAEKEDEVNTVVEAHKDSELPKLDDPELEMEVASQVESGKGVAPAQAAVMCIVAATAIISALVMFLKFKKKVGVEPISNKQAELLIKKDDPSRSRMDAAAESCNPSEMSSYSYSYDNKREEEEARGSDSEAQSKDERRQQSRRNNNRESLASSSSEYTRGSVSYGSFTTYSVLPTKKGEGNEATPVRRSSRISKHLITP